MRKITGLFIYILLTVALSFSAEVGHGQKDYGTDTTYEVTAPPVEKGDDEDWNNEDSSIPANPITYVAREVSLDTIANLKKQKEFYYMAYLDSLLRSINKPQATPPPVQKVERKLEEEPHSSIFDSKLAVFIYWGVAIFLLAFVIYKLFVGNNPVFVTNSKVQMPTVDMAEEEMDEDNLDGYLQKAIRNKNYRLAVRYQYLKTLQRLGEKGVLQLSIDKTNYQYAKDLSTKPYANAFAKLSLQYEYAWFGGFELNEEQFAFVQQQHTAFLKEI